MTNLWTVIRTSTTLKGLCCLPRQSPHGQIVSLCWICLKKFHCITRVVRNSDYKSFGSECVVYSDYGQAPFTPCLMISGTNPLCDLLPSRLQSKGHATEISKSSEISFCQHCFLWVSWPRKVDSMDSFHTTSVWQQPSGTKRKRKRASGDSDDFQTVPMEEKGKPKHLGYPRCSNGCTVHSNLYLIAFQPASNCIQKTFQLTKMKFQAVGISWMCIDASSLSDLFETVWKPR